jgi:hypothetical protein
MRICGEPANSVCETSHLILDHGGFIKVVSDEIWRSAGHSHNRAASDGDPVGGSGGVASGGTIDDMMNMMRASHGVGRHGRRVSPVRGLQINVKMIA